MDRLLDVWIDRTFAVAWLAFFLTLVQGAGVAFVGWPWWAPLITGAIALASGTAMMILCTIDFWRPMR